AGLFDNEDEAIQRTFTSAVRAVNKDRHEKREELPNVYLMQEMPKFETDPFDVELKVCKMLNDEVVGIFGPQEKVISEHVQSICDTMEVPHISVRQDSSASPQPRGLTLNLYPHVSSLSQVYDQLVTEFKWKSFAILYEDTDSLIRMHLLLKRWDAQGNFIFVYHLGYGPNYRQAMQEIKKSEIENLIIDCSYKILDKVLKQAQQVGLLSDKHKVIVTSLDLQTLDLEPYQYSGVNFTGLRLIDPEDPIVQQTVNKHKNEWGLDDPSELRVEPALMYDAVQLFARAFKQLKDATRGDVKKLPCDGSERWEHGLSLSNFMRSTETRGITGLVKFDRDGFRSNIQLDIVRLTENGMMKIGVWNSSLRNIDWIPDINVKKTDVELTLQNQTFIVLISLTPPYGMQTESWTTLSGNERYEGFGIDIIDHISKILGFNYTLQVESNYGSYNEKIGKWSGISILYRKPTKAAPSLFSFLSPFSNDVWIYLIGAYMIVSLLLFVIGRLSPKEWNNPYPCIEEAEELSNQFTMKNAFWFAIGSIMQQGSEIAPIGISTRMMAASWWFFCLIIVSSYTANLAAFLTVETITSPFDNVEELARKKTIKYGTKRDGATFNFFKESNHSTYREMYEYMMANADEVLQKENYDGVEKVKKEENYAFLMESSSIEYNIERECNVSQIGGLLDEKGYGIAMKKDSPYRNLLNTAILKLSESGIITELKKKWWTQKRGGGKCRENGGTSSVKDLDLENVGGVFLVLMVGVALSCIFTIFEFLWEIARISIRENVPFKQELINELKFVAKCRSSKSARRRNGLSSKSGDDSTKGCTPPYNFVPTNGQEMLFLYVTVAFMPNILGFPKKIPIGGLFDSDEMIQKAFEMSVEAANRNITTFEQAMNVSLISKSEKVNKDTFHVANIACELLSSKVAGIFGPQDKSTASHIQSMCDTLDIPHIAARWDPKPKRGNTINLYPHPDKLSMDLQTLDLEPYKYSGVNITGIRLIDPESSVVRHTLESQPVKWNLTDGSHLRVEAALAYDAVQLFASGYTRLRDSIKGNLKKLFCNRRETWGHGFSLSNYMRNERIHGLTGMIKFDTAGFRSEFQLDIVTLSNKGLEKIGKWETNLDPYGMLKESASILTGNDRYEGFAVDIIHEMSKILGFNYTLEVQIDNAYGSLNPMTGKWDGMIARLLSGVTDLAITDLTITSERESAVDFTSPFMNLGISVLYRKPTSAPPSLLSFLGPFSKEVWLHLIAAYVVVVAVLYIIGRLCPREWKNPYPCIKEPEVFETPFTLEDTPFLVIGAILKAPTGLAPAGISTRALAVAWWFFALIITSTYLANLAAALATKSVVWPFEVAEQLAYQHKIKYGAKKKGSSLNFFKDSSHEPYMIMYKYMMDNADEVLLETNEDGVRKVQQENYAFIMESSTIEYNKQRKCNITQVGGLLDAKGYGIAMRKGVPYRTDLSGAVLKMQESGMMNELQLKWWKQKRGGNVCEEKPPVTVEPLNFEDVGGVFLIMISGVMSSWIFAGLSFLWNIRNNAIKHNVSYKEEFLEELKFLAKCTRKKIVKRCSIETLKSDNTDF
ncbi:Glutamate receptor, ionotropic kainate, partial [Ooceraea biroi]